MTTILALRGVHKRARAKLDAKWKFDREQQQTHSRIEMVKHAVVMDLCREANRVQAPSIEEIFLEPARVH